MLRAFLPAARTSAWLAAVLVALAARAAPAASLFDPAFHFRTLRTPHFTIYFHQGEDHLAARLARIAEDAWPRVGGALGVTAPRHTHVVLADQSDLANGWATPLPYDLIVVTAAAPAGSDYIGQTDDWLRVVFIHEFTHIVHLDRSEGWARGFRDIFGRTPIAFPNVWLPVWQVEGLAAWQESVLTGEGRLHAGDFRAIEQQAARQHRVEPLDRASGGLTDWPAGNAPYAFGLGFHQYLADRFGEARFGDLATATARRLPFFGSRAFKNVYGQPLGVLWKDYTNGLLDTFPPAENHDVDAPVRLTHDGHTVLGPRFAGPGCGACAPEIVYTVRNPNGFPALRAISRDGTVGRELTTRYLGSTVGIAGSVLVFDQQEVRRNIGMYSDLYVFDRESGGVRELTHEQRLADPDLSPDGRSIVAVKETRGRRDLVLVRLTAPGEGSVRASEVVTLISEENTQFNAPRWSPDGQSIAVQRHQLGAKPELAVVTLASRAIRRVARSETARIVTPAWRPDGRAIVAAADFDDGPFNLYEFPLDGPDATPRQLTSMPGGALWPDVSPDGTTLVFAGYTADGFDVFTMRYPQAGPSLPGQVLVSDASGVADPQSATAGTSEIHGYSPWPTLLPTSWAPAVSSSTDQLRLGVATGGYDVLGRHAWSASLTWPISRPEDPGRPSAAAPDWNFAYAYDRWRPTSFVSVTRNTLYSAGPPDAHGRPLPGTLREDEIEAGTVVPFRHVRVSEQLLASVARTDSRFVSDEEDSRRTLTAGRLGFNINSAHTYGYSVSPEGGVLMGTTGEYVPPAGQSSAGTATADARVYLPGIAAHHVVAVRAAGGVSSGDDDLRRTFLLGGPGPDLGVVDFGHDAFSVLRAFPIHAFSGTRAALLNADYRWPIARPQRGIGTWPLMLHTIHAAVFADAGHVWTTDFRAQDIKTSVGAELSLNMIGGYVFPFTLTAGGAWGHDGADGAHHRAAYIRIGRAF